MKVRSWDCINTITSASSVSCLTMKEREEELRVLARVAVLVLSYDPISRQLPMCGELVIHSSSLWITSYRTSQRMLHPISHPITFPLPLSLVSPSAFWAMCVCYKSDGSWTLKLAYSCAIREHSYGVSLQWFSQYSALSVMILISLCHAVKRSLSVIIYSHAMCCLQTVLLWPSTSIHHQHHSQYHCSHSGDCWLSIEYYYVHDSISLSFPLVSGTRSYIAIVVAIHHHVVGLL